MVIAEYSVRAFLYFVVPAFAETTERTESHDTKLSIEPAGIWLEP
jgi:hypothetical protein